MSELFEDYYTKEELKALQEEAFIHSVCNDFVSLALEHGFSVMVGKVSLMYLQEKDKK